MTAVSAAELLPEVRVPFEVFNRLSQLVCNTMAYRQLTAPEQMHLAAELEGMLNDQLQAAAERRAAESGREFARPSALPEP